MIWRETAAAGYDCDNHKAENQFRQQIIIASLNDHIYNNTGDIGIDNGKGGYDSGQKETYKHKTAIFLK